MAKKPPILRGAFGNTVLTYRKRAGLSAQGLADKLGVERKTVVAWENNKRLPYPCNWQKLMQWVESEPTADLGAFIRAYAKALTEYESKGGGAE